MLNNEVIESFIETSLQAGQYRQNRSPEIEVASGLKSQHFENERTICPCNKGG